MEIKNSISIYSECFVVESRNRRVDSRDVVVVVGVGMSQHHSSSTTRIVERTSPKCGVRNETAEEADGKYRVENERYNEKNNAQSQIEPCW